MYLYTYYVQVHTLHDTEYSDILQYNRWIAAVQIFMTFALEMYRAIIWSESVPQLREW